jgi:hypothetical protein
MKVQMTEQLASANEVSKTETAKTEHVTAMVQVRLQNYFAT